MGTILDDSELALFDCINSEVNRLSGNEINYYAQDRELTKKDPLYGEPTQRVYKGFRINAYVQWPKAEPEAGELGFGKDFDGMCILSRSDLDEQHAPYPFESDVIEMWRTPYHDAISMGKGMYFDVIKMENDGHLNDTASFVQFKLYLKRSTQFGAERRLQGP